MTSDQAWPRTNTEHADAGGAGGFEEAVRAALKNADPPLEVADLHVHAVSGEIRLEGRVGSPADRDAVVAVAQNAIGQGVHDGLDLDQQVPATAPTGVVSGYEQEDDTLPGEVSTHADVREGPEDPQSTGTDPFDESKTDSEYMEPGVEHRRSRGPEELGQHS